MKYEDIEDIRGIVKEEFNNYIYDIYDINEKINEMNNKITNLTTQLNRIDKKLQIIIKQVDANSMITKEQRNILHS